MRIALVGPCAPIDVRELMTQLDGQRAASTVGYRGVPVSELAKALHQRGHDVSVIATTMHDSDRAVYQGSRFKLVVVPAHPRARDRALGLWRIERRMLAQEISAAGPDVVHAHWTYEFAWAAQSTHLPLVVTAHDAPFTILNMHRDAYRLIRLGMALRVRSRLTRLTVVSPYLGERWRSEMLWRGAITVIPNISPFTPTQPSTRSTPGFRIVSIGNSDARKNLRSLLAAWPIIRASIPTAELHLIGPGLGPNDGLRHSFDQSEVRVHWHGEMSRPRIQEQLAHADLMIHPSLEESQGLTLLEAMAYGIPVIGGLDAGAVPWTLGGAGELTDVRDPAAIAAATLRVFSRPELASDLGAKGRERVTSAFSSDAVSEAYEAEYEKAVHVPPS